MSIKKAIFPVAGLGSRFLPATKATPKEMLPIVDKPLIQYAVEEAVRAGINHMIFITNASKRAIEDHFDKQPELEQFLEEKGKQDLLDLVKEVSPEGIHFSYVRQRQPLGLGHAVLCAAHLIGNEPFVVLLADDLIDESDLPCLSTLVELFTREGRSILAVQNISREKISQYGVIEVNDLAASLMKITRVIEKPQPEEVKSDLVSIGRYVFTPTIFECLRKVTPDKRGEIQLTDAIQKLLKKESVYAYRFNGLRYDCGSKLGYLQAMVEFGRKHPEMGHAFTDYLHRLMVN